MTGTGTQLDPYRIYNYTDLTQIQSLATALNTYFVLNNDIDCNYSEWTPLFGPSATYKNFIGKLDGNGYKIENLKISSFHQNPNNTGNSTMYAGFVGKLQDTYGSVNNVTFSNSKIVITDSTYTSDKQVLLAGTVFAEIGTSASVTNVHVHKGTINIGLYSWNSSAALRIGGIAATCSVTPFDLCSSDQVTIDAYMSDNAARGLNIAGLSGGTGIFTRCFSDVTINPSAPGGSLVSLFGGAVQGTVETNNYARGSVFGDGDDESYSGGLFIDAGYANCNISKSYVVFDMSAANTAYAGLVAARQYTNTTISSCYQDQSISGSTADIGRTIAGTLTGSMGEATTANMKIQSNFVGWDFTTIWHIDPDINDGYPYLLENPPLTIPEPPIIVDDPEPIPTRSPIRSLYIPGSTNLTNSYGYLILANTALGEAGYDKTINYLDIEYIGSGNFTIYASDLVIKAISLPYQGSKEYKRFHIPLGRRIPKEKLRFLIQATSKDFVFYNAELDIRATERRYEQN